MLVHLPGHLARLAPPEPIGHPGYLSPCGEPPPVDDRTRQEVYIASIYTTDISVRHIPEGSPLMLELAILGLLKEQPMHGYQLSRELGESLGGFWRVSYGSLYPTLRRLERAGEVEAVASAETSVGRRKQVYRITAAGRGGLPAAVAGDPARQPIRGPAVPGAAGVLPLPAARDAPAAPGAPARLPRGSPEHHLRLAAQHPRARRRLHAVADGARPFRHGVRHRVGGRPDLRGAHPPATRVERSTCHEQGSSGDRGRGQLRLVARSGTRVLPGRGSDRSRARPDARRPRRLPHRRRRGGRRVRRGRRQGRQGRRRGHLHGAQQHLPLRRRAAHRA